MPERMFALFFFSFVGLFVCLFVCLFCFCFVFVFFYPLPVSSPFLFFRVYIYYVPGVIWLQMVRDGVPQLVSTVP